MVSDHGIVAVHRISAAAEIIVAAFGCQQVVGPVVDSFVGDCRTVFVPLCGVIENNVENDRDSVFMEFFDQTLKLICFHSEGTRCRVAGLGSKETQR